ncbi:MAG: acyltransferase [bacterium]|nr:acyltransferase [bacterium]
MSNNSSVSGRQVYMDNIRLFMVIIVIVLHAAAAYSNLLPWWGVQEPVKSRAFDMLVLFADGFQLPVLYFLAGFFAFRSLRNSGHGGFMKSRFKRLGLPFLVVGLFFVPFISYISHVRAFPEPLSFIDFWLAQMKTLFIFEFVHYKDMATGMKHALDYSPWHLWFISLLMLFYGIFAGVDYLKKKIFGQKAVQEAAPVKEQSGRSMILVLLGSGFVIAPGIAGASLLFFDWSWATFSGFFMFQPTRVPLYAGLFALGIYGGSREWFVKQKLPGKPWVWGLFSAMFSVLLIMCMGAMFETITPGGSLKPVPFGMAVFHGFARSFLCIACIGFSVTLAEKYLNRPSRIVDSLSGVSYEIYLLHLPIVVMMQYLVAGLPVPMGIKFAIVLIASLLLCWSFGKQLFKPRPRWAAAVAIAVFVAAAFVLK